MVKNPPAMQVNAGSIPGMGRLPGEGNGNPLQCSCLENPMDRGAWCVRVGVVVKSWTRLNDFHFFSGQFVPLLLTLTGQRFSPSVFTVLSCSVVFDSL